MESSQPSRLLSLNDQLSSLHETNVLEPSPFSIDKRKNTEKPLQRSMVSRVSSSSRSNALEPTHKRNHYTVGVICALEIEFTAFRAMLDLEHQDLNQHLRGTNNY